MKNWVCCPIVILLLIGIVLSPRAQNAKLAGSELSEVNNTLLPFLEALQNGDVAVLKSSLSKEMYKEYQVLLEENKEYGDFLRDFYRGVRLSVDEVVRTKSDGTIKRLAAKVRFTFPDGRISVQEISLNRTDGDALWKIARLDDKKNKSERKSFVAENELFERK